MPLEPNTLNDETESAGASAEGMRVKLAQSPALTNLLAEFSALQEAIMRNAPVKRKDVKALGKSLNKLKFPFRGTLLSAQELKTDEKFKQSIEKWRLIASGKPYLIGDISDISYLTDAIADLLGKSTKGKLYLEKLMAITDRQLTSIVKFPGHTLSINAAILTEPQIIAIAQFQGSDLRLKNMKKPTEAELVALAKFEGEYLMLDQIAELTDEECEAMSQFQAGKIHLYGLKNISDDGLRSLGKNEEKFQVPSRIKLHAMGLNIFFPR